MILTQATGPCAPVPYFGMFLVIWSTKTSSTLGPEQPGTETFSSSPQKPFSAFILWRRSFSDHSILAASTASIYYGIQLIFFRVELQTATDLQNGHTSVFLAKLNYTAHIDSSAIYKYKGQVYTQECPHAEESILPGLEILIYFSGLRWWNYLEVGIMSNKQKLCHYNILSKRKYSKTF